MSRKRLGIAALSRLLAASPHAIYALDERRRIVFCNSGLENLVGVPSDQLLGRRCEYASTNTRSGPVQISASLCPPPEVFDGRIVQHEMAVVHESGHTVSRIALHLPLGSDPLDGVAVMTFLVDPTAEGIPEISLSSEASELHHRLATLRRKLASDIVVDQLIGISPAISRIRSQIELASRGQTRVVVCGPHGSGREHVARLIHQRSLGQEVGPIVPLCCPLMDAELLQTTVRAFSRQFLDSSIAPWPTLLLLDVDQLPGDAQRELAGFFQLPKFELFTVATSERPLDLLVGEGGFLRDLAEALSTLVIEIPSLVDRKEDIPLLCQSYLESFSRDHERQLSGFSEEAMDELVAYHWPDNVDEIAEVVEESCRATGGPFVQVDDLAERIRIAADLTSHPARVDPPIVLDDLLADIEKELISRAMLRSKGNKTRAAALLGISRARLIRRVEQFGL